jgi:hypothetical protein
MHDPDPEYQLGIDKWWDSLSEADKNAMVISWRLDDEALCRAYQSLKAKSCTSAQN